MERSRRSVLRLASTSLAAGLAGCGSLAAEPPELVSRTVDVEDARCIAGRDRRNEVSASYDRSAHELSLSGTSALPAPCPDLFISSRKGVGSSEYRDSARLLTVDLYQMGECESCPAEVDYNGSVTFDRDPSAVHVFHTQVTSDGDMQRVGPLTSVQTG